MTIDEQVAEILTEGRAIKANETNIYFFLVHALNNSLSADIRTIAHEVISNRARARDLCFDGHALAIAAVKANDNTRERAREVIYQVRDTCEI